MNTVSIGFVEFKYPKHWLYRVDDNIHSIFNPKEGCGAIQISILSKEISEDQNTVDYWIEEYPQAIHKKYAEIDTVFFQEADNMFLIYNWIIVNRKNMAYITYTINIADSKTDDGINELKTVKGLLNEIKVIKAST